MVEVSLWPKGFFRLCYLYNILKCLQIQKSEFQCFLHKIKLLTSLDINFSMDHRDKTEVPEPLALEDLISCKLNNKWELARLTTHLNFPLWPRPMKLTA